MVDDKFCVSKWIHNNCVLTSRIGIEWPSKSAKLAAVSHTEVLVSLTVVDDLPAHEAFAATDGCHSEHLLPIALELKSLFYFDSSRAPQVCVAEVFGVF